VNVNFSQTIMIRCADPAAVVALLEEWDIEQASAEIMGYMGTRLLVDRDDATRCMIVADFGVIDPDVSAADEATRNNDRPETQAWAERLSALVSGEPEYRHYDELYRTDF
jgi:hypothetical protein